MLVVTLESLISGCATVTQGSSQSLLINTDPAGAKCEVLREGTQIGEVDPTPGSIEIRKSNKDLQLRCRKQGFREAAGTLPSSFDAWTLGNILIGGIIGVVVDAGSGAINRYEPQITVSLEPDSFEAGTDRDSFYDGLRAQVLQRSERAKTEIRANCSGAQCDARLGQVDAEVQAALKEIEALRGRARVEGSKAAAGGPIPDATRPAPAAARVGDRWTYRLVDQGRAVGVVGVEILRIDGDTIGERVSREAFQAERTVGAGFAPERFSPLVVFPDGFQLTEFSAYFPPGTRLAPGQTWNGVPAEIVLDGSPRRAVPMRSRVVAREQITVPAGEFDSWKVEALSDEVRTADAVLRVKATFWYSSGAVRPLKIAFSEDRGQGEVTRGTYVLVGFQAGR
jgi:hypothetical protein